MGEEWEENPDHTLFVLPFSIQSLPVWRLGKTDLLPDPVNDSSYVFLAPTSDQQKP